MTAVKNIMNITNGKIILEDSSEINAEIIIGIDDNIDDIEIKSINSEVRCEPHRDKIEIKGIKGKIGEFEFYKEIEQYFLDIRGVKNGIQQFTHKYHINNLSIKQKEFDSHNSITLTYYIKNLNFRNAGSSLFSLLNNNLKFEKIISESQITSKLQILDPINKTQISLYDNQIDDICWLLSFALACPIVWTKRESYINKTLLETYYRPSKENSITGSPIINSTQSNVIKYIQKTLNPYNHYKNSLKLNHLFDYLLASYREPHLEIKYQLLAILMETIKYNYAINLKPRTYNPQKSTDGSIREFKYYRRFHQNDRVCKASFKDILEDLYKEFKIPKKLRNFKDFIKIRNSLLHSGKFPDYYAFQDCIIQYKDLVYKIQILLLSILDYEDHILTEN